MDPGTALLLATVAQGASSVVEGYQGYQQGKMDAQVAGQNAAISRDNARLARLQGAAAEEAKRREIRASLGRSAAAIAQAGGGTQGTAGKLLSQSAAEGELDALNIRYGADSDARASEQEARNYDLERYAAKRRAKGAVISGLIGAGSSALSGYAQYGSYRRMQAAKKKYGR